MSTMSVASVFTLALQGQPVTVWDGDRVPRPLPMHRWLGVAGAADRALLSLCAGPTVDVGCGPGRMAEDLAALGPRRARDRRRARGRRQTRAAGRTGPAAATCSTRCRARVAGAPSLLADGNIGIGGDPVALLRRVAELLAPDGRVVVDVAPLGPGDRGTGTSLESPTAQSGPFPWTAVGPDAIGRGAPRPGWRAVVHAPTGDRWFAVVGRDRETPTLPCVPDARPTSPRGCASPAVTARVGLWLGICFAVCLRHRPHQPLCADAARLAAVPDPPRLGLPRHAGRARRSPVRRPCRCCWSSSGRVFPKLFARPPTDCVSSRCTGSSGSRSRCWWRPRSSSWRPGWRTPPSGTRGPSPSVPPTTPSPGWRSARWCVHVAVKLPVIRDGAGRDVGRAPSDRPTGVRAGVLTRRGLLRDRLGAAGRGRPRDRRRAPSPLAAHGLGASGSASGDGPQGVPVNQAAAAAGVVTAGARAVVPR